MNIETIMQVLRSFIEIETNQEGIEIEVISASDIAQIAENIVKNCSISDVGGSFLYELKTIAYGKGLSSERLEEIKEKLFSK